MPRLELGVTCMSLRRPELGLNCLSSSTAYWRENAKTRAALTLFEFYRALPTRARVPNTKAGVGPEFLEFLSDF